MKLGEALAIGIGLIVAALVFGVFFYNARSTPDTVSVVGAATQRFDSDIVKWRITVNRNTGMTDVNQGYSAIQGDVKYLRDLLKARGLSESDLTIQPVNTYPSYDREGTVSGYSIQQGMFVITSAIAAVESLALNPAAFVAKGIMLQNSNLEYFYSKLADVKLQLLALATEDARKRADELVRNSSVKLGKITGLRQGVFQITEPFSTEVSDYGVYNTQTKQKEITVTVRASFEIR